MATINQLPHAGYATVTFAPMADGKAAISVYNVRSRFRILRQEIDREARDAVTSLSLRPGSYVLEIGCERPNASLVLHGGFDFDIAVEAGTQYIIDCAPSKGADGDFYENNFTIANQL